MKTYKQFLGMCDSIYNSDEVMQFFKDAGINPDIASALGIRVAHANNRVHHIKEFTDEYIVREEALEAGLIDAQGKDRFYWHHKHKLESLIIPFYRNNEIENIGVYVPTLNYDKYLFDKDIPFILMSAITGNPKYPVYNVDSVDPFTEGEVYICNNPVEALIVMSNENQFPDFDGIIPPVISGRTGWFSHAITSVLRTMRASKNVCIIDSNIYPVKGNCPNRKGVEEDHLSKLESQLDSMQNFYSNIHFDGIFYSEEVEEPELEELEVAEPPLKVTFARDLIAAIDPKKVEDVFDGLVSLITSENMTPRIASLKSDPYMTLGDMYALLQTNGVFSTFLMLINDRKVIMNQKVFNRNSFHSMLRGYCISFGWEVKGQSMYYKYDFIAMLDTLFLRFIKGKSAQEIAALRGYKFARAESATAVVVPPVTEVRVAPTPLPVPVAPDNNAALQALKKELQEAREENKKLKAEVQRYKKIATMALEV